MHQDWAKRRNALNHDWLKNEFTQHLRAFIARLESTTPATERLAEFAAQDWPKWKIQRNEFESLLNSAENELSPRRLFENAPLSRCPEETRAWLSEVVHTLWLARTSILSQVDTARTALVRADQTYTELSALLGTVESIAGWRTRPSAHLFRVLDKNVEDLADRVSELPHKVQVV